MAHITFAVRPSHLQLSRFLLCRLPANSYFCNVGRNLKETESSMERWEQRLENYGKALRRLSEIVNESKRRTLSDYERDSIVKRFEFTFECSWRVMKSFAESQGVQEVGASRDSIRQAVALSLIEDSDTWMEMIKWRNETAHNYNGEVADNAINKITTTFFPLMVDFYHNMKARSRNIPIDMFNQPK